MDQIFKDIFERSPIAKMLVRDTGEIELVNKRAEELFQYDKSELIGKKIEVLVPEAVRDRHPELVKEYVKAPLPRQMGKGRNLFGTRKDGSLVPVEVGLNPIEKEGKIFVLCCVIDISERIRAEERFKAAVEAAPNGMLMIDEKRNIVLINKQIEEIFGYTRQELIGKPIEILVPDDFKAPHPKFVESYFRKPEPRSMGIGRELFGKHKSGKLVSVEIGLQPFAAPEGAFVIASVIDITARRNAEVEISRKNSEIQEFSYRTSHDLKSPLKSISAMADFIKECLDENDLKGARENTDRVKHLSSKLLTLIEDIMTLTKVEMADEMIAEYNFEEFSKTFEEKYADLISESKISLEFNFLHRKPLRVQPTRLTQILDNLISNAIKYRDPNKSENFVKVRTFNDSNHFFIHIEDNGIGIPEDRKDEVFGMFKRFHSAAAPGSGLGLYLIKKQVTKLGAHIGFESSSSGTTFYLELPIVS